MAGELVSELNRLAGTSGLEAAGAANAWAETTRLELVGALNYKASTGGLELEGAIRAIALAQGGNPNLSVVGMLASLPFVVLATFLVTEGLDHLLTEAGNLLKTEGA